MFSPRHATSREWFRAGFFSSLGVAIMALVAWLLWQFAAAVLVICVPFVVALVLALLLDPLADRLERRGLPRLGAVGIIFGAFLLLVIGFGFVIVPALVSEAENLRTAAPSDVGSLKTEVSKGLAWIKSHNHLHIRLPLPKNYNALTQQLTAQAEKYLSQSTGGMESVLIGTATTVLDIIITLIVTFFLLADIDKLRARFFFLLPERARKPMKQISGDIGGVFADYLRGLLIVCGLYGVATILMLYGLAMTPGHWALAGYALLVGTAAGILYAVPYLGSLTTALITFVVAFAAGGFGLAIWAIGLLLVINQVFDNIVTPRVVGGGVGLHPVLAIFALIVGGEMFHIWGMLLSVPIAASIQVILFRVFPRLTEATPSPFLRAQGIPTSKLKSDTETAKTAEGDQPQMPPGPSEVRPALDRAAESAGPPLDKTASSGL